MFRKKAKNIILIILLFISKLMWVSIILKEDLEIKWIKKDK